MLGTSDEERLRFERYGWQQRYDWLVVEAKRLDNGDNDDLCRYFERYKASVIKKLEEIDKELRKRAN